MAGDGSGPPAGGDDTQPARRDDNTPPTRRTPDARLAAQRGVVHCDSRWWYWVAALPAVVALWAVAALWVVVTVSLRFAGGDVFGGAQALVLLPAVALGIPALVVFLVLPLALWRDGEATRRAGAGWPELPAVWAALAGLVDLVLVAGPLVQFELARTLGFGLVLLATLAGVGLALAYLRARRQYVWMPESLYDLKRELRQP